MESQPDDSLAGDAPTSKWTRATWGVVALLMAIAFLSHFNRISMAAAGDSRIMPRYGIDPEQMGWVYTAFLVAYTASMIPGGWFIDRFGARVALMVVLFGSSLFVSLTGAIGLVVGGGSPLLGLLVVRSLMGVVSAPLHPSCARAVGDWVMPGARVRGNGLVTGAALLGIAVTQPVFGGLIDRFDWPTAFLIAGGVTAALGVLWTFGTMGRRGAKGTAPPDSAGSMAGLWDLARNRSLVMLTLSYAAVGYFQYLFAYWMNHYLKNDFHLPEEKSRYYSSITLLAMAVGMMFGGWLSDRLATASRLLSRRAVVPVVGLLAGAAFMTLGVLAKEPTWVVAWFALAMAAVGLSEGPFWTTAIELGGRRGGTSAALFNFGGNFGGLLAPVITPLVGKYFGWPWAVALGGFVCLLAAGFWCLVDPGERAGAAD